MHPFITEITPVEENMLRERGVGESFGVVQSPDVFDMDTGEGQYSTIPAGSGGDAPRLGYDMSVDTFMAQVDENGVEYGLDNTDDYDDLGVGDGVILLDDNAEIWRAERMVDVSDEVVPTAQSQTKFVQANVSAAAAATPPSTQQHIESVDQAPLVSYYHPGFQLEYSKQDPLHYDAWKGGMAGHSGCPFSPEAEYPRKRKRRKSSFQGEGIQKLRVDHDGFDTPCRETHMRNY
ncbi:hypothetical protein V1509DRAFT_627541 [Lipomyces kononenkoae]